MNYLSDAFSEQNKIFSASCGLLLLSAMALFVSPAFAESAEVPAAGSAELCRVMREAGPFSLSIGRALAMRVTNDGACSVWLFQLPNGIDVDGARRPFDRTALTEAPALGSVSFSSDDEKTFVTYEPRAGVLGEDRFAFRLMPGNGYYPVTVSVQAPQPHAAVPRPGSVYVYFDLDKSALTADARTQLDQVAAILTDASFRDYRLQISGHADASGTSPYNLKLSERRTDAVLQYLMSKSSLKASGVRASAYGDQLPLNPKDRRAAENRRVHITFVRGERALADPVP